MGMVVKRRSPLIAGVRQTEVDRFGQQAREYPGRRARLSVCYSTKPLSHGCERE